MEDIENKVNEYLGDIRDALDDHPSKSANALDEKVDFLEDIFNFIINYIYAEQDNLNELNDQLKGDK